MISVVCPFFTLILLYSIFSWEEFCADVAIEKVASYVVPSEKNKVATSGVSQEKGLNVIGLDSLNPLRLCDFEPTAKRRRFVT